MDASVRFLPWFLRRMKRSVATRMPRVAVRFAVRKQPASKPTRADRPSSYERRASIEARFFLALKRAEIGNLTARCDACHIPSTQLHPTIVTGNTKTLGPGVDRS